MSHLLTYLYIYHNFSGNYPPLVNYLFASCHVRRKFVKTVWYIFITTSAEMLCCHLLVQTVSCWLYLNFSKLIFYSSCPISEFILQYRRLNSNIDAIWLKVERQVNNFIKITLIHCNCITRLASYSIRTYSLVLVEQNIFIYISVYTCLYIEFACGHFFYPSVPTGILLITSDCPHCWQTAQFFSSKPVKISLSCTGTGLDNISRD